jgi:WD40 repeat protein
MDAEFSPDGKLVVTGSHDKHARIWDAETGTLLATLSTDGSEVQTAEFSPDGKRLVTASFDGVARIWDVESAQAQK